MPLQWKWKMLKQANKFKYLGGNNDIGGKVFGRLRAK